MLAAECRRWTARAGLALALCLGAGCDDRGEADDADGAAPLETVDVRPPPVIDLSNDPQAPARAPALSGVMPEDFPPDLPLYLPASLVDFGSDGDRRSVSLLTATGVGVTLRELESRARAGGWTVTPADGGRRLEKGGRSVRLVVEDAGPGTLYRYVY